MMPESQRPTDRRILRTRRMLRDALFDLIRERGYDGLTITDITAHADLRRATFYMHYKDVDELLFDALTEWFNAFTASLNTRIETSEPFYSPQGMYHLEAMLNHIADHADLYRPLFTGQAGTMVSRFVRDYLFAIKLAEIRRAPRPPHLPAEWLAQQVAGTEIAMITWWLEEQMPYPPQKLAAYMQEVLVNGLAWQFSEQNQAADHRE